MNLTNREKAVALLNSIQTGATEPASYVNPTKYIQHNLSVADGLAGFGAVLQNAPEGGFKVKVVRAFEDGDFVFCHSEYDFFGPKVGIDVFRFEDGLIVEHWDNLDELAASPNPSGRTQLDGETAIRDLDKTAVNKAFAKDFIATILVGGEFDKIQNYFNGNNYIQHNPVIADGIDGLQAALKHMAENNIHMVYEKIHYVHGEGNYALVMSEGNLSGIAYAYFDLLRIKDFKIAEHWGVMAPILPKPERKNNNGKF